MSKPMKLVLVNIFPTATVARYLLSSYVLKAYLAQHFADADLTVKVLNFSRSTPLGRMSQKVVSEDPCAIGYSCYLWNISQVEELICILRENLRCIHILGGPEISETNLQDYCSRGIGDFFVIGEGEKKLTQLMIKIMQDDANPPSGVAHCDSGHIIYEPSIDAVNLLDAPSAYLSGSLEERLYTGQQVFLETQRGCRQRCHYCLYHKGFPNLRYYPIERIVEEIDHLVLDRRVSSLRIIDSDFTSDLARAKSLVKHLIGIKETKGRRLPWIYWELLYQNVDDEFLALTARLKNHLRVANHDRLEALDIPQLYSQMLEDYTVVNCIGVQSFLPDALRAVGRPVLVKEKFEKFMRTVRRYNLVLKVDLILGLPCETIDSFFEGLEYMLPFFEDTDHILNIHRLQILPGSDIELQCTEYGITYYRKAPHTVIESHTFQQEEMDLASRLAALFFRMFNSPLRGSFFETYAYRGIKLRAFLENVLCAACASKDLRKAKLIKMKSITDEDYWNDAIFREIKSSWLRNWIGRSANATKKII